MSGNPIGMYFNKKPDPRAFKEEPLFPLSNKYIGVEIEAENVPYTLDDISDRLLYWTLVTDGSLRNFGAEFVSRKLRGADILIALDELSKTLRDNNIVPEYTDRTSVHIHIDARHLLFEQLKVLVLLYLIYEPLMFAYIGKNRDKNSYCIPYYKNVRGLRSLANLFSGKLKEQDAITHIIIEGNKYEAMNVYSMKEHGSIEFRHHYGTHDKTVLIPWIQALLYIFQKAKAVSADEVLQALETNTYQDLVANFNAYLRVPVTEEMDILARYNVGSLLAYSVYEKEKAKVSRNTSFDFANVVVGRTP